jgi:hypothetical protein
MRTPELDLLKHHAKLIAMIASLACMSISFAGFLRREIKAANIAYPSPSLLRVDMLKSITVGKREGRGREPRRTHA